MQNSQLDRLLGLIRRTGEKAFVIDRGSDQVFMLMDIDDYEDMLDTLESPADPLNDDPIEDYILDDILDTQEKKEVEQEIIPPPPKVVPDMHKKPEEPKDPAYVPIEEPKMPVASIEEPALDFTETWPEDKKPIVEEMSMQDVPHDDEDAEEFRVEPI